MKLILICLLPLSIFAQEYKGGAFVGTALAYDFAAGSGEHINQGSGHIIGLSAVGKKTDWLYFTVKAGINYTTQPGYKAGGFYVDVAPEIKIIKGLFIGKPCYLSPSMYDKQNDGVRSTALEIGHGVSMAYDFGAARLEAYYLRSINKISESDQVFTRSYGARLYWYWRK